MPDESSLDRLAQRIAEVNKQQRDEDRSREGDAGGDLLHPMIGLVYARAEVLAAAGKHAAAITEFDDAVRRGAKWGGASPSQIGDILIAARSHHALGNHEATRARIADAEKLARKWGAPGPLGEVKHAEAMLNGASDQIDMLREAVSLLERSPARLEHARALIDLGSKLRRSGQRRDSRPPLKEG